MNIKEFYGKLKNIIRCNSDYKVVDTNFHEVVDLHIDDEHKEIVLKFSADLKGE